MAQIFEELQRKDHEQVIFCYDKISGLRAIIAIHDTTLGPALGGCRMLPYKSEEDALRDVLRLSRGMTYKAAVANLTLGGGKAVIIGDPKTQKTEGMFRAFGRYVQALGGRYITAEDVGTSVQEMEWVHMETDYVTGTRRAMGGSGDPSPVTAFGVFHGIRAALKWATGEDALAGKTIAIQGLGQVGMSLLQHLANESAKIIAADIDQEKMKRAAADYPTVEFVSAESIYDVQCDVFVPCALGGVVNDDTINRLRCQIVAGSANNVLADEDKHSLELQRRNILYVPDYVISAGGLINVSHELSGYRRKYALQQTADIYSIVLKIFQTAKEENVTTLKAANTLAERRIEQVRRMKHTHVAQPPIRRSRGCDG